MDWYSNNQKPLIDRLKELKKGECRYCDRITNKIYADNVFNPRISQSELLFHNFNFVCPDCLNDYIRYCKAKGEYRKEPIIIWELLENGTIRECNF